MMDRYGLINGKKPHELKETDFSDLGCWRNYVRKVHYGMLDEDFGRSKKVFGCYLCFTIMYMVCSLIWGLWMSKANHIDRYY